MELRFKKLYDFMTESGALSEMGNDYTGDWLKDKKKFIKEQIELEELANLTEINIEEDDE